jgi:putative DNA primase/helicase
MLDCADGMGGLVSGYTQNGILERWADNAEKVRSFPLARLVMSASFAAPLLRIVGQRIFIIHLWGNTTGGKSASTFAALSIWGDPEEIIGSFNATKVGLERMASFYCDLPLGIDEKQVAGDKQGFIESIVYLLGLGKGKTRGAKGGGM